MSPLQVSNSLAKNLSYVLQVREGLWFGRMFTPVWWPRAESEYRLYGRKYVFHLDSFLRNVSVCARCSYCLCVIPDRFCAFWFVSQKFVFVEFPQIITSRFDLHKTKTDCGRGTRRPFYAVQQEAKPWNLSLLIPNWCNPSLGQPATRKSVKQRSSHQFRKKKINLFGHRIVIPTKRKNRQPFSISRLRRAREFLRRNHHPFDTSFNNPVSTLEIT